MLHLRVTGKHTKQQNPGFVHIIKSVYTMYVTTQGDTIMNSLNVWKLNVYVNSRNQAFSLIGLGMRLHCKNIWVTSTILWSSQLHACCVRDTLQTSRDAFNLIESKSVVETLLLFVNLGSSCRKPSYLATFLDNHATKELLQGRMCRI